MSIWFSETTGLRSKLTVQSRSKGNFPLWSGECVFLTALFSDRTLQMPTPLHQKRNVGNYFLLWKIIIPPTEIRLSPTFKHRWMQPHISCRTCGIASCVSVLSVQPNPCWCDAVRVGGGVHAQGLLIGLIKQSCCSAPERIILPLPSFFVCFALKFSKRYDLHPEHPPSLSLSSPPVLLQSLRNHELSQRWAFDPALPFGDKCCSTWPLCPLRVTAILLPH